MASTTPKPRFKQQPIRGMPQRVESYCLNCGRFIAASDKLGSLKIAEKAHACLKVETLKK